MKIINLGEIAKIDISNVDKKTKETDSPVVLCNFVDVYHNWAITNYHLPNLMKSTANDNQISRFSIHKGQVAITKDSETRDDIGVSTYIADGIPKGVLGYHCALITPDESELTGKYLNIVLHTPYAQKYFELNASGSGQRYTLTVDIIAGFPVPIPEIEIQHIIGDFYSAIDKRIAINNRINAELESMAKTIYDYWFTQFDFPDENGKPYKSSGGKMVWNEELKREIPEGWEVGCISDLGEIVAGGTPSTSEPEYYTNSGIAWITPYDLSNTKNKYISHGERDITSEGLKNSSAILMPKGTVLLTSRAPIGYLAIAKNKVSTNQGFKSIVPNKGYTSEYIYQTIYALVPYLKTLGTGSTFTEISKTVFSNTKIVLPPITTVEKYANIVSAIEHKRVNCEEENKQLASLRDWLLPMLMNGQVGFEG